MTDDKIAQSLDLVPLNQVKTDIKKATDNTDYEVARENIHQAINLGSNSLQELADIAATSQHPRAYEAMTEMLKAIVQANKDLLDIKKMELEIADKQEQKEPQAKVVNQNLFVGSTSEVMTLIEQLKDKNND